MVNFSQPVQSPSPALHEDDGSKSPHIYIGGLSPRVTEYMLQEIFAVAGPVAGVKIIPDRNLQPGGANYGFVEFKDIKSAETALLTLNGRKIFDMEIKCNWANQPMYNPARNLSGNGRHGAQVGNGASDDLFSYYHVFVGDLSAEVNDQVLHKAFSVFGTVTDARVMFDAVTGRTRGFGFVAFSHKTDAEQAIAKMNGEWLGSRAVRVNWANQKNAGLSGGQSHNHGPNGMASAMNGLTPVTPQSYEVVASSAPVYNSTIYVGNLVPYVTQADLIPMFQGFGYIHEIRTQADRGFAFVKLDTHENAAKAIVNLNGQIVHGRQLKCSWGKDRQEQAPLMAAPPPQHIMYAAQQYTQPYAYLPQPSSHEAAAHAAAMAAWQAQYGAQYAAYMQQQAALAQQGRH